MPYANKKQQSEAQQQHYRDNREKYRHSQLKHYYRNKRYADELKSQSCCKQCGESHLACLEFHHRNPDEKDREITKAVSDFGFERLKREIAKCDIVCANCHAKLHYKPPNYIDL
jgi:hypothetical protein